MKNILRFSALALGLFLLIPEASAQWSMDPAINNAICTAAGSQSNPSIIYDGSGGAIIAWNDNRTGTGFDIYAQRIDINGNVQWTTNGVAISTAASNQILPIIVSDGAGGAIITWEDYRNSASDIYAQRINSIGVVQWAANGVEICTADNEQLGHATISDGSGGALITWLDFRFGSYDIYAQRINISGAVQWTTNGEIISTEAKSSSFPTIASDENNGAVITWQDYRDLTPYYDIYAQRIDSGGVVQWTPNGVTVSAAAGDQKYPTIASDGTGGAIITWEDSRSFSRSDIYAQRINAGGTVQWAEDGVAIDTAATSQHDPVLVSDGKGGAIITWYDGNVYAQRIDSNGFVRWATNGVIISVAANIQGYPVIISGGSGGAIITWEDYRTGSSDIYAQKVDSSGIVQWIPNGIAISTSAGNNETPALVVDGTGGAIITWLDRRNVAISSYDIYASKIFPEGALPVELATFVVTANLLNAELVWKTVSEINNYGFEVERRAAGQTDNQHSIWNKIGFVGGSGTSSSLKEYRFVDSDVAPGRYAYRIKQIDNDGTYKYTSSAEVEIGGLPKVYELTQNYPNPFNPSTTIRISLPQAEFTTLKVYNTLGEEIASLISERLDAGTYSRNWDAANIASGVYFYRLQAGSFVETKKLILLR